MNRPRKDSETFEEYRENQKRESEKLKKYLKGIGRFIWRGEWGTRTRNSVPGEIIQ